MSIADKARQTLNSVLDLASRASLTQPAMEGVYRDLFVRDITALGIEDSFYPVGGAANHSLLYLITRCLLEVPVGNVLELGAGQSSILFNQLNDRLKKNIQITTVEHDANWAARVQGNASHTICVTSLVKKTIEGHSINHYAEGYFDPSTLYDLILIDGPPSHHRNSAFNRLGAIEIIENNLAENFVIIIDDAQRRGEQELINLIRAKLKRSGRLFNEGFIRAVRHQRTFAGGAFSFAAYF